MRAARAGTSAELSRSRRVNPRRLVSAPQARPARSPANSAHANVTCRDTSTRCSSSRARKRSMRSDRLSPAANQVAVEEDGRVRARLAEPGQLFEIVAARGDFELFGFVRTASEVMIPRVAQTWKLATRGFLAERHGDGCKRANRDHTHGGPPLRN